MELQFCLGSRWQLELSGDAELLSGDGDATFGRAKPWPLVSHRITKDEIVEL